MKRLITIAGIIGFTSLLVHAQLRNSDVYKIPEKNHSKVRTHLRMPVISDYETLKCDFHSHTYYSDGHVSPEFRVLEAWQDGLDALAITDHLEYVPFGKFIKGDYNTSSRKGKEAAAQYGLIVVQGIEITRDKPIGHLNALFVTDGNKIKNSFLMKLWTKCLSFFFDNDKIKNNLPVRSIDKARAQGAFIMWNHPGWPDDKTTLYDIHKKLINDKKIDGVEIINGHEYYPAAISFAKDYNLAYMGNSDIHTTTRSEYGNNIRPMTLVFAKERNEKALKEALFDHRTITLYDDKLFGPLDLLAQAVLGSFDFETLNLDENTVNVSITNRTDINYQLEINDHILLAPANETITLSLPNSGSITVLNAFSAENKPLVMPIPKF